MIGTFVGAVPGTGTDIAAFLSYGEAKRSSKNSDEFGKGAIEGIAALESGNNACVNGVLIPMFTLGVAGIAKAHQKIATFGTKYLAFTIKGELCIIILRQLRTVSIEFGN